MQINPMMIKNFMTMMKNGGGNPESMVMNMLTSQSQNNPMIQNLLALAQKGDKASIERIARNMLQSQGYDFDKEFGEFMQFFNS